jgi:hypothetical protein
MMTISENHAMNRLALALCSLILIGMARPAQAADTISDNLTNTRNGGQSVNNNSWPAQAFATSLTAFVLESVTVDMSRDALATGTVELIIYDAAGTGGRPGSAVSGVFETIDVALDLSATPTPIVFSGLSVNLNPSTTYYLVLRGTGMSGGDALWSYTNTATGIGFPSNYSESNDSGGTWDAPVLTSPQKMSITAVPEPSTLFARWPRRIDDRIRCTSTPIRLTSILSMMLRIA